MNVTVRRQARLLRRVGEAMPHRHRWGCRIHSGEDGLDVHIAAPGGLDGVDLDEPGWRLHDDLLRQLPPMLRMSARSEVGVVRTETRVNGRLAGTQCRSYALATCADVVITLADQLSRVPVACWRGTCQASDLDPELPVVLGPSTVLSLTAGALEMPDDPDRAKGPEKAIPNWMAVHAGARSPYPPHDAPLDIEDVPDGQRDDITYWAAHAEHWIRPMRTTRATRGQYEVRAALPPVLVGQALWVEALVSLDTRGRYWQASLSFQRDGGRWWLTQPWSVEVRPNELLGAAVGQVEPPQPALDPDTVDGESFGWAPALLTAHMASMLDLRRSPR